MLLFFVKLKARFLSYKETRIYSFETPAIPDQPRAFVGLASTVGAAPSQGRLQAQLSQHPFQWRLQTCQLRKRRAHRFWDHNSTVVVLCH